MKTVYVRAETRDEARKRAEWLYMILRDCTPVIADLHTSKAQVVTESMVIKYVPENYTMDGIRCDIAIGFGQLGKIIATGNQKIVKQSEPVVKNIMSGKIPKSADIKLSGRGFGSKSSVTSHAADSIPLGAVKVKDTGASADVGWEKSDNSEHFYVKFINWGTIYRPPQEFIYATGREADAELQKIAEQEYQSYLDNTLK